MIITRNSFAGRHSASALPRAMMSLLIAVPESSAVSPISSPGPRTASCWPPRRPFGRDRDLALVDHVQRVARIALVIQDLAVGQLYQLERGDEGLERLLR